MLRRFAAIQRSALECISIAYRLIKYSPGESNYINRNVYYKTRIIFKQPAIHHLYNFRFKRA